MSDIDVFLLINMVEERPVLWDRGAACYRDKTLTALAWEEVCAAYRDDYESLEDEQKSQIGKEVIRKWINIRDSWSKWQKKHNDENKPGAEGRKIKRYVYHRQLEFLKGNKSQKYLVDSPHLHDQPAMSSIRDVSSSTSSFNKTIQCSSAQEYAQNNSSTKLKRKKATSNEINEETSAYIDVDSTVLPNSNFQFFLGIFPALSDFNADEILEFQMGILQIIKDIKNRRSEI